MSEVRKVVEKYLRNVCKGEIKKMKPTYLLIIAVYFSGCTADEFRKIKEAKAREEYKIPEAKNFKVTGRFCRQYEKESLYCDNIFVIMIDKCEYILIDYIPYQMTHKGNCKNH